eukprot:s1099_g5.t1
MVPEESNLLLRSLHFERLQRHLELHPAKEVTELPATNDEPARSSGRAMTDLLSISIISLSGDRVIKFRAPREASSTVQLIHQELQKRLGLQVYRQALLHRDKVLDADTQLSQLAEENDVELTLVVRNVSLVVTASADCTAKIWNWLDGECIQTLSGCLSLLVPANADPKRPKPETTIASSSQAVDAEASRSSSSASVSRRKRYISMLVKQEEVPVEGGSDSEPAALEKSSQESAAVQFTLENLQAFCDTADGIVLGKTAAEARPLRRRRPNYNSSKRKLLAKMPERTAFLAGLEMFKAVPASIDFKRLDFAVLPHCPSKVWHTWCKRAPAGPLGGRTMQMPSRQLLSEDLCHERVAASILEDSVEYGQARSSSEAGDDADLPVQAESLEQDEELRMHLLGQNSQSVETNFAKTIKSLPTRFLAPGNLHMLYEQWGRRDVSCFGWTLVSFFFLLHVVAFLMAILVIETARKLTAATGGLLHAFKKWRLRKLTWLMGKIGIRNWIGESCQVKVTYIDSVRDWKGMLQQAPVTFSGGLKEDSSGLHCFLAMRRQGETVQQCLAASCSSEIALAGGGLPARRGGHAWYQCQLAIVLAPTCSSYAIHSEDVEDQEGSCYDDDEDEEVDSHHDDDDEEEEEEEEEDKGHDHDGDGDDDEEEGDVEDQEHDDDDDDDDDDAGDDDDDDDGGDDDDDKDEDEEEDDGDDDCDDHCGDEGDDDDDDGGDDDEEEEERNHDHDHADGGDADNYDIDVDDHDEPSGDEWMEC